MILGSHTATPNTAGTFTLYTLVFKPALFHSLPLPPSAPHISSPAPPRNRQPPLRAPQPRAVRPRSLLHPRFIPDSARALSTWPEWWSSFVAFVAPPPTNCLSTLSLPPSLVTTISLSRTSMPHHERRKGSSGQRGGGIPPCALSARSKAAFKRASSALTRAMASSDPYSV